MAAAQLHQKPASENLGVNFDSGINASAAWTEHVASASEQQRGHVQEASLSDEEEDIASLVASSSINEPLEREEVDPPTIRQQKQPARTLYDFEGKPEFGELSIQAGVDLLVLKADAGDGWSLVDYAGRVGLIPASYYALTSSFIRAQEAISTPQRSPGGTGTASPIEPQLTGSYLPNFRKSLLGRRSLNRFASFVTSGAEDWVLHGSQPTGSSDGSDTSTAEENPPGLKRSSTSFKLERSFKKNDRHFIDSGISWRSKVPAFQVMVHSPYKHTSAISSSYTMYQVTSFFTSDPSSLTEEANQQTSHPSDSSRRVTVHRRFSHFVSLHTALTRDLPGLALPPLPGKQYAGRFNDAFVEARRSDLEKYISRLVRHPVVRYSEALINFMSCESDADWRKYAAKIQDPSAVASPFYSRIYHPSYALDLDECKETGERFAQHVSTIGSNMQRLRSIFGRVREGRAESAASLRMFAYSVLGLITSQSVDGPDASNYEPFLEQGQDTFDSSSKNRGHVNNQNAWCWRDNCPQCLGLTIALQKTAESLQHVASLYDSSANQRQFTIHEHLKDCSHPLPLYEPILDIHRGALANYRDFTQTPPGDDELVGRCETVLTVSAAEIDVYHTQKVEDFRKLAEDYLDEEIDFHEKVLQRLKVARANFKDEALASLAASGSRQPSIFERDLGGPKVNAPPDPVPQPCPHVFDSTPMRPVSAAVERVGLLRRGSVLSRFW